MADVPAEECGVDTMEAKETTTRVYQYGAVPVGPFPKEGVDELWRANRLWNQLVEIGRKSQEEYKQARREAYADFREISEKIDAVDGEIKEAYSRKRAARSKARTMDAEHPLIREANREIDKLKSERKKLREKEKPLGKEADKRIDKKALNAVFNERVKAAQRVKNTGGLNGATANEVARYFKVARGRTFENPGSRLRFHGFDGTGFFFYRFRRPGENTDGVNFKELVRGDINIGESFSLRPGRSCGGHPVMRLRAKVAGGAKKASRVYAEFDLHLHRPIPEGAQINNAKLLRRRVGDRFRYTVSFSVRVSAVAPADSPPPRAAGVDIGFKMRHGAYRVATIAIPSDDGTGWKFDHLRLPAKYVDRMNRAEEIQSKMDDSATDLGDFIKPRLKGHEAASDESHPMHGLIRRITNAPAHVTLSFELAYKLGGRVRAQPGSLPAEVEKEVLGWRERWRKSYGEMHGLRKKTLGWRREMYRVAASKLVSLGLPIGIEEIDLRKFAEVRDADNALSNQARSQRFDVAPSEFLGALRNCAEREGVPIIKVDAKYTSKTCAECGCLNSDLGSEVEWKCPECGAEHDRDENAALNISRRAKQVI